MSGQDMNSKAGGQDFEKKLKRLAAVVEKLESGDLPLEKGVSLYKEGLTLARECRETLGNVKNEISVLAEDGFKPFGPGEESAEAQGDEPETGVGSDDA